jgi:hypothetical protein
MREVQNMKITRVTLGYEDHGILTCSLSLSGEHCGQGFGGYCLDEHIKSKPFGIDRIGTAFGLDHIMHILWVVGVDAWEDLPGKFIRVERENGHDEIVRIGHITDNKWFNPKEHAEQWRARK